MTRAVSSWNRIPQVSHRQLVPIRDRCAPFPALDPGVPVLAHGQGRSYGDVCLNPGGDLLMTRGLDRFVAFDPDQGVLECEAGVLLGEILDLIIPQGWFLPVTPGTSLATLGGAIANDVHGKNHHGSGTFGDHVLSFWLARSDGTVVTVDRSDSTGLFAATIGGLGLTGLILCARIQLQPVTGPWMDVVSHRFATLDEYWALTGTLEQAWPYTVSWLDCTSREGRGIAFAGRHAEPGQVGRPFRKRQRSIPVPLPIAMVNRWNLKAFNALYWRQPLKQPGSIDHYLPFFYPLDAIAHWNRLYGPRGFHQYQCVIPPDEAQTAVGALVREIAVSGYGSFLAVLKRLGDRPAPGLLSFARPGTTLALDFADDGAGLARLLSRLDSIVLEAGGALYPAKDARMSPAMFRAGFPQWEAMTSHLDPAFSSGFWRRVTQD